MEHIAVLPKGTKLSLSSSTAAYCTEMLLMLMLMLMQPALDPVQSSPDLM